MFCGQFAGRGVHEQFFELSLIYNVNRSIKASRMNIMIMYVKNL